MGGFRIVTVEAPGNPFVAQAFGDVARLLTLSLRSLGHPCRAGGREALPGEGTIVLGYHLLDGPEHLTGRPCTLYQLEHLARQRQDWLRLDGRRAAVLRAADAVWEFSRRNAALLAAEGIGTRHLPVGSHPGMETVPDAEPDIDVLFYGAVNARRKAVLDALAARCRVKTVFGAYGARRDALIARARIVLNLRSFPETGIMEQPRVSYLLNNRRFVVTETAEDDPYGDAVASVPYDGLAECCLRYLADASARRRMAARGYEFLAARPMTAYLEAVLSHQPVGP